MKFKSKNLFQKGVLIFLMLFILFPAVSRAEMILDYNISVLVQEKHPFLIDHQRKLIIKKSNAIIEEVPLYADPGTRVPLNLFRDREKIIFIDCDGNWHELSLADSKFKTLGWFWKKKLPSNYIGTFRFRENDANEESFQKEASVEMGSVYLFKDPPANINSR